MEIPVFLPLKSVWTTIFGSLYLLFYTPLNTKKKHDLIYSKIHHILFKDSLNFIHHSMPRPHHQGA
jgi:hypothetical protein